MFKVNQEVMTPKGKGVIIKPKYSTYSKQITFYYVRLENNEEYLCAACMIEEINV